MINPQFWQDHQFDAAATFIVAGWLPGFTHKGYTPKRGTVFDKSGIREDRLRSLYESRWIRMAEAGEELTYQQLAIVTKQADAVVTVEPAKQPRKRSQG